MTLKGKCLAGSLRLELSTVILQTITKGLIIKMKIYMAGVVGEGRDLIYSSLEVQEDRELYGLM